MQRTQLIAEKLTQLSHLLKQQFWTALLSTKMIVTLIILPLFSAVFFVGRWQFGVIMAILLALQGSENYSPFFRH